MSKLCYIRYKIKFKNSMEWLDYKGYKAFFHRVDSPELIIHLHSLERVHEKWISYACVRITRTKKIGDDETFYNKENRIFIRKDDKFIELNGRSN